MRSKLAVALLTATTALSTAPQLALATTGATAAHVAVAPELAEQLAAARSDDTVAVFASGGRTDDVVAAVHRAGLATVEVFERFGMVAAAGPPAAVRALHEDSAVRRVDANLQLELLDDVAHRATGVDQLRDAVRYPSRGAQRRPDQTPFDGAGVSIAVVDIGFDPLHPQFVAYGKSKFDLHLRQACVLPREVVHYAIGTDPTPTDCSAWVPAPPGDDVHSGHGTITAGVAAAYPRVTPSGARISGTAPGARLVGLSIGAQNALFNSVSALNWILEHHRDPCGDGSCPPIRVVNNSYGLPADDGATQRQFDPDSPMSRVTAALIEAGVVVVFAVGNDFGDGTTNKTNYTALHPLPGMISVGAFDDGKAGERRGGVPEFSSRGQRGDPSTYPDLVAPGTHYRIGCPPVSVLCRSIPGDGDAYGLASGTSMAAPYVVGVVAQLLEANPTLTPAQVEDILEDSAYKGFIAPTLLEADRYVDAAGVVRGNADNATSFHAGHGLVDAVAALSKAQRTRARVAPSGCPSRDAQVRVADPVGDSPALYSFPSLGLRPNLDIVEVHGDVVSHPGALTIRVRLADLSPVDAFTHLTVSGHVDSEYFEIDYDRAADQELTDVDVGAVDATVSFEPDRDSVTFVVRPRDGAVAHHAGIGWSFTSNVVAGLASEADFAIGACSVWVPAS